VVSGYKVWPRDVEDVLYQHPAVAEAAVIGVPDEYRAESVTAFVVLQPNASLSTDDLNRHSQELLSAYKCLTFERRRLTLPPRLVPNWKDAQWLTFHSARSSWGM